MDDPISARYVWDPETLTEAWAAYRRDLLRPVFRYLLMLMAGLAVLGYLSVPIVVILDFRNPPEHRRNAVVAFVVISLIWGWLLSGLWTNRFLRWNARKAFRSLPGGVQVIEWSIGPDDLNNRAANSSTTLLWTAFHKVVEDRKGFLLFHSAQSFHFIPSHAFTSELEMKRFASLARGRVAKYLVLGDCQFPAKPEPVGLDEL